MFLLWLLQDHSLVDHEDHEGHSEEYDPQHGNLVWSYNCPDILLEGLGFTVATLSFSWRRLLLGGFGLRRGL